MSCDDCESGQECDPNEPAYIPVEPGGNGPSVADEEALLQEEFGEPNQDGVYAAVVET